MTDDLAKEIASSALGIGWLHTESAARKVAKHSADRIEELTVKNKQLEDELDHAQKWEAALLADFAELKAKLARAVETLERTVDASRYYAHDRQESDKETLRYAHECTNRLARATLAELRSDLPVDETRESQKGDSDE